MFARRVHADQSGDEVWTGSAEPELAGNGDDAIDGGRAGRERKSVNSVDPGGPSATAGGRPGQERARKRSGGQIWE